MKSIVLGGGCFWCVEAVFQRVEGVKKVVSGYAGGDLDNPTYHNHGNHAEVIKVDYDETVITLEELLKIFFASHNPTTLNFQGNDYGTQYRSIILCQKDETESVEQVREQAQSDWEEPIVTEIKVLNTFHEAEDYHQDYFNQNPGNPYCQVVINPKIAKFEKNFQQYKKTT